MKAPNLHVVREFNPDRKETHCDNGSSQRARDRRIFIAGHPKRPAAAVRYKGEEAQHVVASRQTYKGTGREN
jgi:hypothetical protein